MLQLKTLADAKIAIDPAVVTAIEETAEGCKIFAGSHIHECKNSFIHTFHEWKEAIFERELMYEIPEPGEPVPE